MVRSVPIRQLIDQTTLAMSHDLLIQGELQMLHFNGGAALHNSPQRTLVNHILNWRPAHPIQLLGQIVHVNLGISGHFTQIVLEDLNALLQVRLVDANLKIIASIFVSLLSAQLDSI